MSKFVGFIIGAVLIGVGIATGNVGLIIHGRLMIVARRRRPDAPKAPRVKRRKCRSRWASSRACMLIGETFTAGSLVDGFNYGGKYGTDWEVLVIRLADHKCDSLTGFYVNDEWSLYRQRQLSAVRRPPFRALLPRRHDDQPLPPSSPTTAPAGPPTTLGNPAATSSSPTRADKPDAKHPAWPGGRPRFGFVVKGEAYCYDPRLDDTVHGRLGTAPRRRCSDLGMVDNAVDLPLQLGSRRLCQRRRYRPDETADRARPDGRGSAARKHLRRRQSVRRSRGRRVPIRAAAERRWHRLGSYAITADGYDYRKTSAPNVDRRSSGLRLARAPTRGAALGFLLTLVATTAVQHRLGRRRHCLFLRLSATMAEVILSQLYTCPLHGSFSRSLLAGPWFSGPTRVFDLDDGLQVLRRHAGLAVFGGGNTGYIDLSGYHQDLITSLAARDFCVHADGSIWAVLQPDASSANFTLKRLGTSPLSYTVTGLVTRSAITAASVCHVAASSHFFVVS
jgi:hypothetical protein